MKHIELGRRLYAMTFSPNAHEATVAKSKLDALLTKYRITLRDLGPLYGTEEAKKQQPQEDYPHWRSNDWAGFRWSTGSSSNTRGPFDHTWQYAWEERPRNTAPHTVVSRVDDMPGVMAVRQDDRPAYINGIIIAQMDLDVINTMVEEDLRTVRIVLRMAGILIAMKFHPVIAWAPENGERPIWRKVERVWLFYLAFVTPVQAVALAQALLRVAEQR